MISPRFRADPFNLTENEKHRLLAFVEEGQNIAAIHWLREEKELGLKDAKSLFEDFLKNWAEQRYTLL